jgi:exodeoxyribonuclease V alpha subunit
MISSDNFPMVHLTEIFRQEDTSDIVYAAHEVHAGRTPEFTSKSDFTLLEEGNEDKALDIILRLAERMYNRRDNFQILSPRHAGTLGVTNLNSRLREILNPKKSGGQEMILGKDYGTIREDDRIMVVKNNYELGVYNGDVGKVSRIDRKAQLVEIKIHGTPPMLVPISFKDVPTYLRLAYAMTVHKSQGQEYDRILMPVVPSFRHQLQRNLLYTGITRAKKKVVLVGRQTALTTAIENNKEDHRNTLFIHRLAKVFS